MDQQNQQPHVSQETLLIRHDFWEELTTMTLKKEKRGTKKKKNRKQKKKKQKHNWKKGNQKKSEG